MSRVALRRLQSHVGGGLRGGNQRQVGSAAVASSESKTPDEGLTMGEEASGVLARVAQLVQKERLVSDK